MNLFFKPLNLGYIFSDLEIMKKARWLVLTQKIK